MSETVDEPRVDIDLEAIRAQVKERRDSEKLTAAEIARQSGAGTSTLHAFLQGTYNGDNAQVARRLLTWLESRSTAAQVRALLPKKPAFVRTVTAEAFLATLEHAQFVQDLVVMVGGAGVGKTTACEQYQRTRPNVWLATAEPSIASTHAMLEYLCEVVGVAENAANRRSRALVARVRGSGGVLIVDEAQHLTTQALDQLRTIHDKAEIGVALVGNEGVYSRINGGGRRAEFAQLFSRVGMRVVRAKPLPKDIEAILDANGVEGREERALLRAIARKPGALRGVTKTLRVAQMQAMGADREKPTAEDIQAAWARLADTDRLEEAA
jgi:DNA transposition AAA+ family ATPase